MNQQQRVIEHIFHPWDGALGAKDLGAAMDLYHPDIVLESPLVDHLLERDEGVLPGRDALRAFVTRVFANQSPTGAASALASSPTEPG